jgi:hypothetical protein
MAMEPQLEPHVLPNAIGGLSVARVSAISRVLATLRQSITERSASSS